MAKIHTRSFRVRWSELDGNGAFAPENYLRYLIETAYDWGDSLGLGSLAYDELGIYWLIRETELSIFKSPIHNDVVELTIWMVSWQKVRGTRCFEVKNSNTGEIIAQGIQRIVSMNRNSNRPTPLTLEFIDTFRLVDPVIIAESGFSYMATTRPIHSTTKIVEWQDLDAQQHVNNAVYLSYAREALARALAARTGQGIGSSPIFVQIQYSSPAVWGEEITIDVYNEQPADSPAVFLIKMKRKVDGSTISDCVIRY